MSERIDVDEESFRRVLRPRASASTLPRPLFTDPRVFEREMERLFRPAWHCIGREDEFPQSGDFRSFEIGESGVIVVRGDDGVLRAFHNVCRHRGSRVVEAPSGSRLRAIQCPYHAWTYDLTGRLVGAPLMDDTEGFDPSKSGLHPAALEIWRGFVFVTLDPDPSPVEAFLGPFAQRAGRYPLERLRLAHRVWYEIRANWKLVLENAAECYHCPGVHPQLVRITPYESGEDESLDGPAIGGWMEFSEGCTSLTPSGTTPRRIFPGLSGVERRRVYYYCLFPANFMSLVPDYVTLDWFIPAGPDRTLLMFDLYVDREEPDRGDDAMAFWDTTNRQDWHVCELAQLGAKAVAYTQGRYSGLESMVHAVDRYYIGRMGFLGLPG